MKRLLRLVTLMLCASVVACARATPAPTSLPPPAVTVATETASPAPSAVAATPTPAPPSPTTTPEGRLGPDQLPANVNPLTGEVVSDASLLGRRPLAVKIVNAPPCARPQYGLDEAAVVFEHYVEAWSTRFTAIFYGDAVEKVGAIRSSRLIDLELPAIFDAVLVTSGSSAGVKQRLLASDFSDRIISYELGAGCPPLCQVPVDSVPCADTEHTMFADARDLHGRTAELGLDDRPDLSGWAFSAQPLARGRPAELVHVNFLNAPVDWEYDEGQGRYLRSQNGNRHVDAETRMRLAAANVVVLYAHHLYTDIRESANFYSLEIQFWGQGRALLFRDGQAFEGQWLRPERDGLFQLVDATGAPIPLKPGRTWFEFAPLDSSAEVQESEWTITVTILPEQTPPRP